MQLPPLDDDLATADVLAALAPVIGAERCARLDAIAAGRLDGVAVVVEDLFDPHNYGAMLRSCESMGIQRVHTINEKSRYRVSSKVTQGSERWLEIHRFGDARSAVVALQQSGYRVLAAVPGARLSVDDIDARERVALAFGNEHVGLSPRFRELADGEFSIPMHGASQSLNVSVSVAVALYVVTAARRRALGRATDLSDEEMLRLRARLYASDTRGHRPIVQRYLEDLKRGDTV